MRTLGLLGGMSWESTIPYYRLINQRIHERLSGHHSAKLVLYSVDFAQIETLQKAGAWSAAGTMLAEAAEALERAGAEALVICSNTMHQVAPTIAARVKMPILHIADATALRVRQSGIERIALLGTRYTMEQDFYKGHLVEHGLSVLVPEAAARDEVHRVIYEELCQGVVREESRVMFRELMRDLAARGAQGIILGCTEIGMLVAASDASVPTFDTTAIHARFAADWMVAA